MALVHLGFSAREVARQVDLLNGPATEIEGISKVEAERLYTASWQWVKAVPRAEILSWLDTEPANEY